MLTITTEKFYTEILKNDIAGLKDIDKTFVNEGEEAARLRFATYVRTSLPFDNYFYNTLSSRGKQVAHRGRGPIRYRRKDT
jgi:hypothetical protein